MIMINYDNSNNLKKTTIETITKKNDNGDNTASDTQNAKASHPSPSSSGLLRESKG